MSHTVEIYALWLIVCQNTLMANDSSTFASIEIIPLRRVFHLVGNKVMAMLVVTTIVFAPFIELHPLWAKKVGGVIYG